MLKNYSIVALRNLARNKLFSFINIMGLSISMTVGLLAITFMSEMHSFDNFHQKSERIYRVVSDMHRADGSISKFATASVYTGNRLATDFAGFEAVAPISKGLSGDIQKGESTIDIQGIYANGAFFDIFSFPLHSGNAKTALNEPYSIILTETTALKLFDRVDVIGEVLEGFGKMPYKVTAVLKDIPINSHLKFEAIASLKTLEERRSETVTHFRTIWSSYVYVLLPENPNMEQIQGSLDRISEEENPKLAYWELFMSLESLDSIFPGGDERSNQFAIVIAKEQVTSVVILALIVLFSACFNYTNLSLARSLKRSKEVGVRKVVGAKRGHLFLQFILEAVFVSIFATIISFGLFQMFKHEFLALDYYIQQTATLTLQPITYLYFLIFAVSVGILAGLFPSIVMTRFLPVNILKGISAKTGKGIGLRKILVGIQFALSMGCATLVILTYKQYEYALNFDLGFTTENILNVATQSNDPEVLKSQFAAIPEVLGVSSSSSILGGRGSSSFHVKHKNPLDSVNTSKVDISPNYLSNMGHQLIAGSDLEKEGSDSRAVVNEILVKKLGISSPETAIGERISFLDRSWIIVGVVKDFHHNTIHKEIGPFFFAITNKNHFQINVKLNSTDRVSTMSKLDDAWKKVDPVNPLSAMSYDEIFENSYSDVSTSLKTFSLLSGIAICISILGLLGMAVYTAETKVKELAIRKVLGATISNLLALLSRNFLVIFILSAGAAIPLAYYMYQQIIVADVVYQNKVGLLELTSGALLIIAIALITISSQTIKAARSNPVDHLRHE